MPPLSLFSPSTTTLLTLFFLLSTTISATTHRRLLHHPFFFATPSPSLAPTLPPHSQSQPQPKQPFSSLPSPTTTTPTNNDNPFFPTYTTPPPPPPPQQTPSTTTSLPTFPANISSLALPSSSHTHTPRSHLSPKLTLLLILLSLLTVSLFLSLSLLLLRRRRNHQLLHLHHHSKHLPPQSPLPLPPTKPTSTSTSTSTTHIHHHTNKNISHSQSHTSTEFLYVGNSLTNSRDFQPSSSSAIDVPSSSSEIYLKLCGNGDDSPELTPLPPLPKTSSREFSQPQPPQPPPQQPPSTIDDDEFFFSPRSFSRKVHFQDDLNIHTDDDDSNASDSDVSVEIQTLAAKTTMPVPENRRGGSPTPPPPPPPPAQVAGPPQLVPPSGPVVFKMSGNLGERKSGERKLVMEESGKKPKLKALHWDKVRATSTDRAMVWDQLQPGSFQLNEEMIETLFKANGPSTAAKDGSRRSILPLDEEYRVLDPKKSQNIAILLKALNVTENEVCEALLEGNADALGSELLESLLKMAPTKEEERKLGEYQDQSPLKLGPAEKFLKAVLDHVPSAFKRVDAMLYITTFDSEVEYLRKSFETLEAACAELRNSRMFLKLLEAVLKTGNRMNVGTNRGDAQAFKLDTLLKLIDVKGTDGKTTLLHFVVQEIIKSEGSRLSGTQNNPTAHKTNDQPSLHDDIEFRKRGLEVVSGLGGELINVKKAAAMDSNALSMEVSKLARGLLRVNEVLKLNEDSRIVETNRRFSESMVSFLKKAEVEILRLQSQESNSLSRVKELTEYFHGNMAEEEAHPLRIFMVVRDFLGVLDKVCKEVGKINGRTIISSARPIPVSVNPSTPPPFPEFSRMHGDSSSDNESITEN